jgi:hypothetical protein
LKYSKNVHQSEIFGEQLILTGDGDDCGDVRGHQDEEWQYEHAHEAESGVQLFLPWLRIKPEGHALVEVFIERPLLHVEDHQL